MKRIGLLAVLVVAVATFAGILWFMADLPSGREPVGIGFLGWSNSMGRTFAVFALTNRQAVPLEGSAYPILAAKGGWSPPSPRDAWVGGFFWMGASTGTLSVATVRVPEFKQRWRLAVTLPSVPRRLTAKEKVFAFCVRHQWRRTAQWFSPRRGEWTFASEQGTTVLGPEMENGRRK